eukprot:283275-Amphidinium_carterae.3
MTRIEFVIIFKGTSRAVPADVPDGVKAVPGVPHWQLNLVDMLDETIQSQAAVDGKQHWLFLMDLAPVHASVATVGELRKRAWESLDSHGLCASGLPVA